MPRIEFFKIVESTRILDVVDMYAVDEVPRCAAQDSVLRFLGTLHSHGILEIEGIKSFLKQEPTTDAPALV